jgi:hypothetical protein
MKRYDKIREHGIIGSILIVLISFALVGTAAAADPQSAGQGWANGTPMSYHQNMMTNGSMMGYGNMMQGYGNMMQGRGYMMRGHGYGRGMETAYPGMWSGAGTMQGTGGMSVWLTLAMILTGLLMLVWLIVGILVICLLIRKLKKEKIP